MSGILTVTTQAGLEALREALEGNDPSKAIEDVYYFGRIVGTVERGFQQTGRWYGYWSHEYATEMLGGFATLVEAAHAIRVKADPLVPAPPFVVLDGKALPLLADRPLARMLEGVARYGALCGLVSSGREVIA